MFFLGLNKKQILNKENFLRGILETYNKNSIIFLKKAVFKKIMLNFHYLNFKGSLEIK